MKVLLHRDDGRRWRLYYSRTPYCKPGKTEAINVLGIIHRRKDGVIIVSHVQRMESAEPSLGERSRGGLQFSH